MTFPRTSCWFVVAEYGSDFRTVWWCLSSFMLLPWAKVSLCSWKLRGQSYLPRVPIILNWGHCRGQSILLTFALLWHKNRSTSVCGTELLWEFVGLKADFSPMSVVFVSRFTSPRLSPQFLSKKHLFSWSSWTHAVDESLWNYLLWL